VRLGGNQAGLESDIYMSALDQSANSGVAEVPDTHRLDKASLTRWMERHVEGFRGPLSVAIFNYQAWTRS
jgi:hypothetical protein